MATVLQRQVSNASTYFLKSSLTTISLDAAYIRSWQKTLTILSLFCLLLLSYHNLRSPTEEEIKIQCRNILGPRKVHVVLPASTSSPRFCRSLSTLLIHDYQPVIVNWQGETHHSSKIFKLLEYLEKNTSAIRENALDLPPQCVDDRADIVISIDSYDVFTQRPLDLVLSQFENMPGQIIYSAEKGCHPAGEPWCSIVPDSPLPRNFYGPDTDTRNLQHSRARFLNSGVVIGYAKEMLHLYTDAASEAIRRQGQFNADQSIFGPLFTSNQYNITLDYLGVMSTPHFFFEYEIGLQPTSMTNDNTTSTYLEDEVPWNFYNRVTGQFPTFVHFNDADKGRMDDEWKQTWWGGGQGRPIMNRINQHLSDNISILLDTGDSIPFRELCPGSWQEV
jgi:hypothetical protein